MNTNKISVKENIFAYLLLLPSFLLLLTFVLIPIFQNVFLSFHNWQLIIGNPKFIGFDNYIKLFTDSDFWKSILVTFIYTITYVPLTIIIGFLLALLLYKAKPFNSIFSTIFYLPSVISMVVMGTIWLFLYHFQYGAFNLILNKIGLKSVPWLVDKNMALFSLVFMNVWKTSGHAAILTYVALVNVNYSSVEAAKIDGATFKQIVKHIFIPLISSTLFFLLIIYTIESFQIYTQISVMTEGGPDGYTTNLLTFMMNEAFGSFRLGYGAAISTVQFMIIFTLYILQSKLERKVNYEVI